MKKAELEKIVTDIQARLNNLEGQLPPGMKLEDAIAKVTTSVNDSQAKATEISAVLAAVQQNKGEVESLKTSVETAKSEIEAQKTVLTSDKEQYEKFREAFEQMQKRTGDLQAETERQLGLVSAEKLANSFEAEAKKLQGSIDHWFRWVFGSVVSFLVALVLVTWWQLSKSSSLLELTYFVRIILTTPIAYLLVFSVRQYSRDVGLYNEYTFKASVARSFEAYRQLLDDQSSLGEGADATLEAKLLEKKFEFLTVTIGQIYSSPIQAGAAEEKKHDQVNVSVLDKLVGVMDKMSDIFKK